MASDSNDIETKKSIARSWFEEGIASNDFATASRVADQIFTDDFIDGASDNAPRTRDEFKERVVRSVFRTFSDISISMEDVIGEGDIVALRVRFAGTHVGPYLGGPATGARIEFTETGLSYFRENRIYRTKGDLSLYRVMHENYAKA